MKPFNCAILALILLAFARPAPAAGPHYVFAHYMVCIADYGPTEAGFAQDIQDAQAAGIDGFAMDVGAWTSPGSPWYYTNNVAMLYQAAAQLGTGFKLFFSIDDNNTNDIVSMISAYAFNTNSFRYQGRLVVSTFCGNGMPWTNGVFQPLQSLGVSNIFFIPFFTTEVGTWATMAMGTSNLLAKYTFLDGLFDFACGLPGDNIGDINYINASYQQACTNAGKVFMAGASPTYWGAAQTTTGRTYFESQGGEGMISQWNWIVQNQPDWVELVTWNDLNESTYINPMPTPDQNYQAPMLRRYSHAGYLALAQHYISWYKTGSEPPINQDALYYFYRTSSTNCVASNTNDVPVTAFMGNVQDVIYTTTFLTSPAQLVVASGSTLTTNALPAGINCQRTPFAPGAQIFTLTRNSAPVLSVSGPPVLAQITNYDYFTASGYAYATNEPVPPSHLHVVH